MADLIVTLTDGTELKCHTRYADMAAFEKVLRVHKMGELQQNYVTGQSFIAWRALKRDDLIPAGQTWEDFLETVDEITPAGGEPTPTLPGPIPG